MLCSRWVSKAAGAFLDSRLSKPLIKPFVKKSGIDLDDYESDGFESFNDCFTRKIKAGKRPFSENDKDLCAPCDGLLCAYKIENGTVLPVKQSAYTVSSLLGNDSIAESFSGGTCLCFRLCVDNYHRYAFFDRGTVQKRRFIPGRLHTVRPIALEKYPVFTENCREYTVLETENFGRAVYVEVGAMLVGKIKNRDVKEFSRGEEKGMFLYGGSTVILLLEKGAARVREEYFSGEEIPVKMGETLN
ncbi:MAG: phosphatidylserine decarboxylase [Clostridia bacterium]|nr:phosphatidylserine decarboxylase [Clostridia bacterium]